MARTKRKVNPVLPVTAPATQPQRMYQAGGYVRLSVEDSGKPGADTIATQRELIQSYIDSQPDMQFYDLYCDNGRTGTNFDRPEFERLMDDVRAGKVDCIVVKDLSRFGRNYRETGNYLERLFPLLGVRFIAVNDHFDTLTAERSQDGYIVPLKNIMNDVYSKDISRKILPALTTKRQNGEFIGTWAAYGYQKCPDDRHRIEPDAETAPVVREMFQWRLSGLSYQSIARKLNERSIPSPARYHYLKGDAKSKRYSNTLWSVYAVKKILTNEVYLGHMIQGRKRSGFSEGRKPYCAPESEWMIVRNTHEPLVDEETFRTVQRMAAEASSAYKERLGRHDGLGTIPHILRGLIYCADCKRPLVRYKSVTNKGRNLYYVYICPSHTAELSSCPKKYFHETALIEILWDTLRREIALAVNLDELVRQYNKSAKAISQEASLKREIASAKQALSRAEMLYDSGFVTSVFTTVMWAMWTRRWRRKKGGSHLKKQYKVGIYCRLSVDDASNSAKAKNYIPGDESASIENQYEILSKFVMLNGWIEVKTYRDDGYSGGNFQRPGFLEMLEDARHGLINLILVKDLSRLGRDFVEVGRYTDVIFPSLGCRFVSVLDCLDSEGDNTDMLHFRSLMNDYHLKDLSGKIKSVLYAKKKSGQYLTAYAPYGYRKSDEDKHRLVVDEEAATVVREIYRMRCSGMAYGKIAAALNEKSILSPRWHWELHYGKKGSCKYSKLWTYATVKNILNDTVYLGIVTQNRTGSRSYKDKTMIQKPETEWICHEDAHEAIVDRKLWETVQEKNRAVKQQAANRAAPLPALFTGKLVCADCGHPLVATRETQRRKNGTSKRYVSYICSHFVTTGRSACSWHRIYEISLKTLVLNEIRAHSRAVAQDENAVLDKLRQQILSESAARQEDSRLEISRLRRRIGELEHMTAKLYEDKVSGIINNDTFAVLIQKSEQERLQKAERLEVLLAEEQKARQEVENIRQWAGIIRRYLDVQELDREIVEELIDHIEIGERSVIDGQRQQDIKIFYRFVGVV